MVELVHWIDLTNI